MIQQRQVPPGKELAGRNFVFPPTPTSALCCSASALTAHSPAQPLQSTAPPAARGAQQHPRAQQSACGRDPLLSREAGRAVEAEPFPSRAHSSCAERQSSATPTKPRPAPGCQLCAAAPSRELCTRCAREARGRLPAQGGTLHFLAPLDY